VIDGAIPYVGTKTKDMLDPQKGLIHGVILGDTKPSKRTIDRIRNEENLPEFMRYKSGRTGLKFTYEHDLETCKELILN